jgi:hypothetical protein
MPHQKRLHTGAFAQDFIRQRLEQKYCDSYNFISMAHPGSRIPDLIVQIDSNKLQFEIKGRDTAQSPITFFDKSARRGKTSDVLNRMCNIFTCGVHADFEQMINHYRLSNPAVGYPGDVGTPKSGKMPPEFRIRNDDGLAAQVRAELLDHFRLNGDNYFVVFNRKNVHNAEIFHTGHGPNPLNAPMLPRLDFVSLDTHGGAYKGSMRVAIKGHFISPPAGLQL